MLNRPEQDRRAQAVAALAQADRLYGPAQVEAAVDRIAAAVTEDMRALFPVLVCVMIGGFPFAAALMRRLDFPLEVDYLHATRYRGETTGASLAWLSSPRIALAGRHVLLVDDILDEGLTLSEIHRWSVAEGAASVRIAVLTQKNRRAGPAAIAANYVGLSVPDRYVFGEGMDYKGLHRNLRGIYAASERADDQG